MSNKSTGSFYTPISLIQYMKDFVYNRFQAVNILEPSAGDGRFLDIFARPGCFIHAIELDEIKYRLLNKMENNRIRVTCADFIDYAFENNEKYDLIIGNPPYISKKNLSIVARESSVRLMDYFKIEHSVFQNLWVTFILGSMKLLSPTGAIFFVLPFEFLQVQYAESLRSFLETKFNSIEIITFENHVFDQIEQEVCLVYLKNENSAIPYIKYTTIESVSNTKKIFESIIKRNKPLKKWSNCILSDTETDMIESISIKYPKIREFGLISPGIVTGANNFFIINKTISSSIKMDQNFLPIISKSSDVRNELIFSEQDFISLFNRDKNVLLLNLTGTNEDNFTHELVNYLKIGCESYEINTRYKCSIRKRWFDVPILKFGDVLFFKRFDLAPKILVNDAKLNTTDIAYNIKLRTEFDKYSFAFCFYNSLTLLLCEYNGRFYGGGVGELVPNEFKDLRIPYQRINMKQINELDRMFRNKFDFADIVTYVDSIVLDLSEEEMKSLHDIRYRYHKRRLKK